MIKDNLSQIVPTMMKLRQTFESHKTLDIKFRKEQLKNLKRGLQQMDGEFACAINKDLGYSEFTHFMINSSITMLAIDEVIEKVDEWTKIRGRDTTFLVGPGSSYVKPEPLGLSLVVGAWNYPLFTLLPQLATTIAAGNVAVIKPSEMSPHTSNVVKQLCDKYLDNSCYQVIEGNVETIVELLKMKWDLIQFTGSPFKGRLVAKAAAENLTPMILELGGKSPCVVDKDCNLQSAIMRISQTKFMNSGQTCVCPDYVMVHADIYDQFKDGVVKTVKSMYYNEDGSVNSQHQVKIINGFFTKRLADMIHNTKGTLLLGGHCDIDNRTISPTIIDQPSLTETLMQEEIFGPIMPIIKFTNIQEVITFIRQREKPLTLYYYGYSNKNILRDRTSSGAFAQNECCFQSIDFELPFGGVGNSGHGCLNTQAAFDQCSHLKAVLEKGNINTFPFNCRFPPYTSSKIKTWKILIQLFGIKKQNKIIKIFLSIIILVGINFIARYLFNNYQFNFSMVKRK